MGQGCELIPSPPRVADRPHPHVLFLIHPHPTLASWPVTTSPEDQAGKVRWEVSLGFGWSYFCLCSVADRQVGHSTLPWGPVPDPRRTVC